MNFDKLNICQVTLSGNIEIIKRNYLNFKQFYNNLQFFIVCPNADLKKFKEELNLDNFRIYDEDEIIKFERFKEIANLILKKTNYYEKIQGRLGWYYQQVLKLTFIYNFIKINNEKLIIWDADTIILKKIKFFDNEKSVIYGTTSEFFKAYYATNKTILGDIPKYFVSSVCQFSAVTPYDLKNLLSKLSNFQPSKKNIAEWFTSMIFEAIIKTHKEYNGSLFSEYELIGHSKLLENKKPQILISGIREGLDGVLSNSQEMIIKILNYKHLTYENPDQLDKKQSFVPLIKLLIKKTSNKIYRGFKHFFKKK
tara:strand:+ start:2121 stop:3050 length:930 start_codon:yes stop_codon:yes gene_type:complete